MRRILPLLFALAMSAPVDARPRMAGFLRLVEQGMALPHQAVEVSVQLDGPEVLNRLRALGLDLRLDDRSRHSRVVYARADAAMLRQLAALPGVRAVERARPLHVALDRSLPLVHVPEARQRFGLDGHGAIIGLVDTGCDFRHADLRDAERKTRFDSIVDFTHPDDGRHPEVPSPGALFWLRSEIDDALAAEAAGQMPTLPVTERDIDGHGTHVLSIASSSGLATDASRGLPAGRYVGMAPGATLVCVQGTSDGHAFSEATVLAGARFVFDRASALGLPAVLNLSLSSDGGPHDGTSSFEQGLDELFPSGTPGRALVVAAGNEGGRDLHASGQLLDGTVEISFAPPGGGLGASATFEVWMSDAPTQMAVVAPDGHVFGPVKNGGTFDSGFGAPEGRVMFDVASHGADSLNQRYEAVVMVQGQDGTAPQSGAWRLALAGTMARWDVWLTDVPVGAGVPRLLDRLDEDGRAETPAFAHHAISVGSFTSRSDWTTRKGEAVKRPAIVGQPSAFSGTGPSSDGRFVPDLSAPGEFVAAALSIDAPPDQSGTAFYVANDTSYLWADDGVHGLLRGTSQAAPHVAGAVALLFQIDPRRTGEGLREILRASARVLDGDPGYSTRSGFGQLDVARAAALAAQQPAGAVDADLSTVGVTRTIDGQRQPVLVSVVPRDAVGAPLGAGHHVIVDGGSAAGAALFDGPVRDLGGGRYECTLLLREPVGTGITLRATVDGVTLTSQPSVWIVADPNDVGDPFAAVGGCALNRRSDPDPSVGFGCLAILLAAYLARRPARR